jgi:hypothetical protein
MIGRQQVVLTHVDTFSGGISPVNSAVQLGEHLGILSGFGTIWHDLFFFRGRARFRCGGSAARAPGEV